MTESRAGQEAGDCRRTVAVAFTGKHKLTQRTAAQKDTAEAGQKHAEGVPERVGVGHRLLQGGKLKVYALS